MHYLDQNNWNAKYQICRVPRSQIVNTEQVELNGHSYQVSLIRLENINSGAIIIDEVISETLEKLWYKHEIREFKYIKEYNHGNDYKTNKKRSVYKKRNKPKDEEEEEKLVQNMECYKDTKAKETKWYNGVIDLSQGGSWFC